MALIRMNHLSFCKGRQTDVSVILPTKGMEDKRNGTSFETPGMKYQTLWLLHGGGGDDMDFVKYSNIIRYAEANRRENAFTKRILIMLPGSFRKHCAACSH